MKRLLILAVMVAVVVFVLAAATPAYACACSGPLTPEAAQSMVNYYNSQPYEWRVSSPITPPTEYGYTWDENYYIVPAYSYYYGY